MADLPTGTVTFLFTDVEGSTRLWEEHPEQMRAALVRHDLLFGGGIAAREGVLIKPRGEGDSVFAVFARADDAVGAACALQQALRVEPWPTPEPLRVRMALHTGEADPRDGDYYGPAVNRCARLRGAAHGGQVLLSGRTAEQVRSALPAPVTLRSLGRCRLRDLQEPEDVFQLLHPELPGDFPPLRTLEIRSNNLPRQVSSFVGREREITAIRQLMGATRLLTLTGTGGTGKTRLALQVGAELLESYPDGVWLVELAPLADPALVPQSAAAVLGVKEEPGRSLEEALVEHLRPKHLLLILDNCEHVLEAAARLVDTLLASCPGVRILATGREPLGITGEPVCRVPSLPVPADGLWLMANGPNRHSPVPGSDPSAISHQLSAIADCESVRLFADRAALSRPGFSLTRENAEAVAEVCRRLDGIPLAIELAAARLRAMPVEQLLRRLDDRFRILTGGSRTALPRQQTLRALIDWSYDLLSEPERVVLRHVSVFTGGWTLEAAEAVCGCMGVWVCGCGPDTHTPTHPHTHTEVLDLLTALVDRSLVIYEERDGEGRYRMLETIRQYSRDRLFETGSAEAEAVRDRHRDWFVTLAEEAGRELTGPDQVRWHDRVEAEHDNFRAALEWSLATDPSAALRIGAGIWFFWQTRGFLTEGRAWLAQVLAADAGAPAARADALTGAGTLEFLLGEFERAAALHREALALYRELGDRRGTAFALNNIAVQFYELDQVERAIPLFEESLALYRELGARREIAFCLNNLGIMAYTSGRCEPAIRLAEEGLALSRSVGDTQQAALTLHTLARAWQLHGEPGRAATCYRGCIDAAIEVRDPRPLVCGLEGLADLLGTLRQAETAARLFGAAEAIRETVSFAKSRAEWREYAPTLQAVRAALGEAGLAAAREAGRAMTQDEAVELAREVPVA